MQIRRAYSGYFTTLAYEICDRIGTHARVSDGNRLICCEGRRTRRRICASGFVGFAMLVGVSRHQRLGIFVRNSERKGSGIVLERRPGIHLEFNTAKKEVKEVCQRILALRIGDILFRERFSYSYTKEIKCVIHHTFSSYKNCSLLIHPVFHPTKRCGEHFKIFGSSTSKFWNSVDVYLCQYSHVVCIFSITCS